MISLRNSATASAWSLGLSVSIVSPFEGPTEVMPQAGDGCGVIVPGGTTVRDGSHGDGPPDAERPVPDLMVLRQAAISRRARAASVVAARAATWRADHSGGQRRTSAKSRRSRTARAQRRSVAQPAAAVAPTVDQGLTCERTLAADCLATPKSHSAQAIAGPEKSQPGTSSLGPTTITAPHARHRYRRTSTFLSTGALAGTRRAADLPLATAVTVQHQRRSLGPARRATTGAPARPPFVDRRWPCKPGLDLQRGVNKSLVAPYSIHSGNGARRGGCANILRATFV